MSFEQMWAECERLQAQVDALREENARLTRIVALQDAALDVWKCAHPGDDSIHLAALAVSRNDHMREALEQIDRETRSASDVAALRYGSIARAALAAAKGE